VGRVLGTQDAMPLEFWVAIEKGEYLELDDVVVVRTELHDGRTVTLHGVVDLVKARHEGVQSTDVFLVEDAVLPAIGPDRARQCHPPGARDLRAAAARPAW
jgi:hypothetical protein